MVCFNNESIIMKPAMYLPQEEMVVTGLMCSHLFGSRLSLSLQLQPQWMESDGAQRTLAGE